ncbi:hypothetical protein HYG90_04285 [Acinetobacter sp. SwsAc7]|nr:hypothetical protein [Acinetobacter sp. SwsAc7]
MSLITINESLKKAIEAASGGAQTVLVTPKGQLTYMNIIEKFDLSTIDASMSGTHPAFIVNGVEKSRIFVGTYPGVVKNGEYLSLPNEDITAGVSLNTLLTAVRSNGAGHHLITSSEWGAISMLASKAGKEVQGNTYYGRSGLDATQYGRRVDGQSATAGINNTTQSNRILTGSGPVSFRHNNKYNGISDLVGNSGEFIAGLRIVNTELQVITNNNAALPTAGLLNDGEWKAINGATGELITPDGYGTTPGSVRITVTNTPAAAAPYSLILGSNSSLILSVTNNSPTPISAAAIDKLKAQGILNINSTVSRGYLVVNAAQNTTGYAQRGGSSNESGAGIFQLSLVTQIATMGIGAGTSRPCYYEP